MTQWRSNIHGGCQIRNRIPWIWAEQGRGDEKSGGNEHGEAVRPGLGNSQTPRSDATAQHRHFLRHFHLCRRESKQFYGKPFGYAMKYFGSIKLVRLGQRRKILPPFHEKNASSIQLLAAISSRGVGTVL